MPGCRSPLPAFWLPLFLLLAGCHDGGSGAPPTIAVTAGGLPLDPPPVSEVVIRPGTVHATAGSEFTLEARVKNSVGQILDVDVEAGLSIAWTSTAAGVFPSAVDVNPVLLRVPTSGAEFGVTATVTRVVTTGGTETSTAIPSAPATVHITPPETPEDDSDRLVVEHVAGHAPAGVVIQGKAASGDRVDWPLAVVGTARLGTNLTAGKPTSSVAGDVDPEVAVFAQDRQLWLQATPWTAGIDMPKADPLPAVGSRKVDVRLGHWDASQFGLIEDQLVRVQALFDENRVGVRLNPLPSFEHSRVDGSGVPLPISGSVSLACDQANNDLAGNTVETGDTLYILFVSDITGRRGVACQPWPAWRARVIYVSWQGISVSTVAHEIVHVLALRSPHTDGNGHVGTGDPGFEGANLMWGFDDLDKAKARDLLTLGQIYRMNLHPSSYLNVPGGVGGPQRSCHTHLKRGPECPALATDLGG